MSYHRKTLSLQKNNMRQKRISPRSVCERIPARPELNPVVLNSTPDFWLHYSFVNMDSKKLFPYPKWRIVVYLEEPVPPCFYIYYRNTAIAASMIDGSIQGIKRKGRNPKAVKYVVKNLQKWLNADVGDKFYYQTNLQAIRDEWWYPGYKFALDGRLLPIEEWEKLPEAQDDAPFPYKEKKQ